MSIAFSLKALRKQNPALRFLLTGSAVAMALFYWMIYEYMIGLEVVRFLLIDYVYKQNHSPKIIQRIKHSLRQAFPFCIGMVLFLVWRLVIFKSARSAADVGLVASYHHAHSIHMLLRLVLEVLKDTVETLLGAWLVPLYQLAVALDYYSLLTALLVGCAGTGIYVAFYKRFYKRDGLSTPESQASHVFLFSFGVILSVVTLLPIILANRDVHFSDQFDRYTQQATIGVSVAAGGLVEIFRSDLLKRWAGGVLIGISLVTHICNGIYYQNLWETQRQFWWQLSWRIPDMSIGTTLVPIFPEGYKFAEGYEVWGPVNRIYNPGERQKKSAARL